MSRWKLPRLISDGMVLQQKKKIRIWGFDEPGRQITVSFLGEEYISITDKDGIWETWLKETEPGGPHIMYIRDDAGNETAIADILVGDVWICAGQSNMELPMERVKDRYQEEIAACENPAIRTFKITEHADFHAPLKDHLTGEWKQAQPDTILQFSATAYFFALEIHQMTGVPVGLINASLGGSRIESWMSREMLDGCAAELKTADRYGDDEYVSRVLLQNQQQAECWHQKLDQMDAGLAEGWEKEETDISSWKSVEIPFFFRDTELRDFIGSVWFKRSFQVPGEMAGQEAKLWLGTIVDSDTVYVNGVQVGHTDYQYPPRKYPIPKGLLREGENTITIRVKCENGKGRFTPDKIYAVWNEEDEIDLRGEWRYRIGASCEQIKPTDFVNWKPTGLFNGMMAPCRKYTIAGVLWYQGESNTHVPEVYLDRMKRMISGYRKDWQDEMLSFFYVQLPNFAIDIYDSDEDETGKGWPVVRELQRQALSIPETGMAVAIDLGEDNDLHPLNKKEIGRRLALLAAKKLYGMESECEGPLIEHIAVREENSENGYIVEIACANSGGGIYADGKGKDSAILDFELGAEGAAGELQWFPAKAELKDRRIILQSKEIQGRPLAVRYCFANTNKGALIYNDSGFPMSPFQMEIYYENIME